MVVTIARQFHRRFIAVSSSIGAKEQGEGNTEDREHELFTRLALARRNFIILTEYKNPVPIVSTCSNSVVKKLY